MLCCPAKNSRPADGPLSLPGLKAGVSRGGPDYAFHLIACTAMYNSLSLVSHSGTSDFLLSRRKITQIISLAILKMSVFTDEARRTGSAH